MQKTFQIKHIDLNWYENRYKNETKYDKFYSKKILSTIIVKMLNGSCERGHWKSNRWLPIRIPAYGNFSKFSLECTQRNVLQYIYSHTS